jgi:hypothetical protein
VDALREKRDKLLAGYQEQAVSKQRGIALTHQSLEDALHARHREAQVVIEADLATYRERAKRRDVDRATGASVEKFAKELGLSMTESENLSAALKEIDALELRLLSDLPIPGLKVAEDDLFLDVEEDGVRTSYIWDRLNSQTRVDIAVSLGELRAKRLGFGLINVDGADALDDEHFAALIERAKRSSCQWIVTRHAAGEPLTIERQNGDDE